MAEFLYEELNVIDKFNMLKEMPDYISPRLADKIKLREYQEKAFQNFVTYYENEDLRKSKQLHLLFHMATGSGKTVIMAGLILYLYTQGYRKFLFFVNQTNIVEKTKENFLNPTSGKYLFSDDIELLGSQVNIKEVENFSLIDENAINICFTTTQKLHMDLLSPKENSLTIEDFEDDKIVLISDESHHINTWTKKPNKTEEETIKSWEYSVEKIFRANKDNALIEFTATCDLKDPNVLSKYKDKIIFNYPLSSFRESGYTKDFQNMQTDLDQWGRTLLAMVISEYRRDLFADNKQNIKPVILLKSQKIAESEKFYEKFFNKLKALKPEDLVALHDDSNVLYSKAMKYYHEKDPSYESLVQSLKFSFSQENSIIMNGSTDNTTEKQLAVNSLEDKNNPYRIIFTVDMLNEGWDVLNLFDIVRLYETRQGSGKTGKIGSYTIKEAQLIGRGARYCPFKTIEKQDRFRRKYDYDLNNDNRILEALLYHSKQDSRYITELRQALKTTGLLPEAPVELEYKLKDTFKETEFYKKGLVFSNKKVSKNRQEVKSIDKKMQTITVTTRISSGRSSLYGLFDEGKDIRDKGELYTHQLLMKEIPINILYAAIDFFEGLKFNVLKSHFPNLKSTKEFLTSDDYLGNINLVIESRIDEVKPMDILEVTKKALQTVSHYVSNIKEEYEGTKEFYPKKVHSVLRDKKIYIDNPTGDGLGVSQLEGHEDIAIDLYSMDWYVYDDNYGTTEEKAFVKYFAGLIPKFKEKYDNVYLVRNERITDFAIYEFDTGERFEPDFLLFLQKKNHDGYIQEQIYIEPKGSHLLEKDKWKEAFLLQIEEEGIPTKTYVDDNNYRIIGLPFFNRNERMGEFSKALNHKFL